MNLTTICKYGSTEQEEHIPFRNCIIQLHPLISFFDIQLLHSILDISSANAYALIVSQNHQNKFQFKFPVIKEFYIIIL